MDWFSWLSKTSLEPSLVYEYGRIFTRNELREEDATQFNHEFLQSMGITIAKHRLEILKLARKERRGDSNSFSRLVMTVNKTQKLLSQKIGKWIFPKDRACITGPDMSPYRSQWTGTAMGKDRAFKSGPMERKALEQVVKPDRSISLSGPMERRVQERLMQRNFGFGCRSPNISGPLDGLDHSPRMDTANKLKMVSNDGVDSLWSVMFQEESCSSSVSK